jgi:UDP-N-acetylmuramyl pentapeptide phosphotransferase/UDP-N-acetylglucosamine-1-phosphate transferase
MAALVVAVVTSLLAATASGLIAWSGPVDPPGPRRSHGRPTPTSGGLAIIVATAVGLALAARMGAPIDVRIGWLALLAVVSGLIGAADDMLDLPATVKLLVQIALALQFALGVARVESLPIAPGLILPLGFVIAGLGTTLWIVVLSNAVNFMDGADGLAPGAVIIAQFGLAVAAAGSGQHALAVAALIGAAAGAGFLPWNLPARRLFQGDAGALFSGFWLAGLAVIAAQPGQGEALSAYLVPFCVLPLLTDVLLTLLARARAGKPLFAAHREHLYQRWLDHSGASHLALSLRFWLIMAAFTSAAVANEQSPMGWRPIGFAGGLAVAVVGWVWLRPRMGDAAISQS